MKKIKNMLKKGGIADIVTLMIIVGLVIALIITVVLPMIEDSENRQAAAASDTSALDSKIGAKVNTGLAAWK